MKIRSLAVVIMLFCSPVYAFDRGEILRLQADLVLAESSGRPWAAGDGGKSRGLMQIERRTWDRFSDHPWRDAFDPRKNLKAGRTYLEHIAKRYGKKATRARIAFTYNTGRYCFGKIPKWAKRHKNEV